MKNIQTLLTATILIFCLLVTVEVSALTCGSCVSLTVNCDLVEDEGPDGSVTPDPANGACVLNLKQQYCDLCGLSSDQSSDPDQPLCETESVCDVGSEDYADCIIASCLVEHEQIHVTASSCMSNCQQEVKAYNASAACYQRAFDQNCANGQENAELCPGLTEMIVISQAQAQYSQCLCEAAKQCYGGACGGATYPYGTCAMCQAQIESTGEVDGTNMSSGYCIAAEEAAPPLDFSAIPANVSNAGNFPQNRASMGLESSSVLIAGDGQTDLKFERLYSLLTGQTLPNKTLEVHFGRFFPGRFAGVRIGTIKTNSYGNISGGINTSGGQTFAFPEGRAVAGQIVINDPGVRTEFIVNITPRPVRIDPCNVQNCGNFSQNQATLRGNQTELIISEDGGLTLNLVNVRDLTSGRIAAGLKLDVFVGRFMNGSSLVSKVGEILLDQNGRYFGPVLTASGPLRVTSSLSQPQHLILNRPGVRSEFISKPW